MSQPDPPPPRASSGGRIDLIDLARGIALLAMFVFHFAYDLSNFGLVDFDVQAEPGWRWFARTIAASFLTLVGISLVLATRNGLNIAAYLKRLAMVAGAAAVVTIGTWFAMRDNFIFFGILHHVALASVIALPFLRLPTLALALAAIMVFAAPVLLADSVEPIPLVWLGLTPMPFPSADFVPVLPWFGWVLSGMTLARLGLPGFAASFANWRARSWPARIIVLGGRNSLLVYLVHQPVFIGLIMLATQGFVLRQPEERPFMLSCQRGCAGGSLGADACEKLCACTVDSLKAENLWCKVLDNALNEAERARTAALAQACLRPQAPRP